MIGVNSFLKNNKKIFYLRKNTLKNPTLNKGRENTSLIQINHQS
jgi:hypothetical protein